MLQAAEIRVVISRQHHSHMLALLVTVTLWFLCQVHLWPHSLQLSLCITNVQSAANMQCKCNGKKVAESISIHLIS